MGLLCLKSIKNFVRSRPLLFYTRRRTDKPTNLHNLVRTVRNVPGHPSGLTNLSTQTILSATVQETPGNQTDGQNKHQHNNIQLACTRLLSPPLIIN